MMSKLKQMSVTLTQSIELSDIVASPDSRGGYAVVGNDMNVEDFHHDDNDDHFEYAKQLVYVKSGPPKVHCCVVCCSIFSAAGVIFLTFLGILVSSNSIYLKLDPPHGEKNSYFAPGVWGGMVLYLLCFGASMIFWLRAKKARQVYELSRLIHSDSDHHDTK